MHRGLMGQQSCSRGGNTGSVSPFDSLPRKAAITEIATQGNRQSTEASGQDGLTRSGFTAVLPGKPSVPFAYGQKKLQERSGHQAQGHLLA